MAASSSLSNVSGSASSSSSAAPRTFSFFGGSNQMASVKLDRFNYLMSSHTQEEEQWLLPAFVNSRAQGPDTKSQWFAPTGNSPTANSEQQIPSESHGSAQMNSNSSSSLSARGEGLAACDSLVNQDLGPLESASPNVTTSTSATNSPSQIVEAPQAQPEMVSSRHHMVTRARDGMTKPKYPFIGLLKYEDPFDKASQNSEPSNRFNMLTCAPVSTPMVTGRPFSTQDGECMKDPSLYRKAIGSLQYLVVTRPDIAFAVNKLSQFLSQPTEVHFQGVKRILRYIKAPSLNFDSNLSFSSLATLPNCLLGDASFPLRWQPYGSSFMAFRHLRC
ncbi:putative copia-type protein [Senna tora]|uniref:Putative copia-type protein n=1 Tax=Senna tora TaxID=362788 RepID=A0A834WIS6_9FABA|nr:putative copia-type protein [Senna tora]